MIGKDELKNRFGYHRGTPETMPIHQDCRAHFLWMASWIDDNVVDGRAKSLALTALQEAAMWTNFGIAEQAPLVEMENPSQAKLDIEVNPHPVGSINHERWAAGIRNEPTNEDLKRQYLDARDVMLPPLFLNQPIERSSGEQKRTD